MADSYNNPDTWDGRYANGDDLNYYAGLIRERVLAKPANIRRLGTLASLPSVKSKSAR